MDIGINSIPKSSRPLVLPPCLYLKWRGTLCFSKLLLYEPTVFAEARSHCSHHPTYIEVPTWAPESIDYKLSTAAYELFDVEHMTIFTVKLFLATNNKSTCFTFSTFTSMAPCEIKELRDILHLQVVFFWLGAIILLTLVACQKTIWGILGRTLPESFVLSKNCPMFLDRLLNCTVLVIICCYKESIMLVFTRCEHILILDTIDH